MMVLKRGRERSSRYLWAGAWRCNSCATVIALDNGDWRRWKKYKDDRQGETLRTKCPICEAERWFSRAHEWTTTPQEPSQPDEPLRRIA